MIEVPNSYYRGTVKAIIRDTNDHVLMVKESGTIWDLPGGGINHGTSIKDAMAEELSEEINYCGEFTMDLVGVEVLERKQTSGYAMLAIYEVTLVDKYVLSRGKDASDIKYFDPNEYRLETADRSLQMLYKYGTRNYDVSISYCLSD